jgi:predicted MPP superfamily phosphohydrolase
MNRRDFLRSSAAAGLALAGGATLTFAAGPTTAPTTSGTGRPLRVGFITDLHHALFGRDQVFRLRAFIDRALATPTDFILQGGDFCYPAGCPAVLAEWNRCPGDKFHVLGNHDMDKCDKATIMKLWGMPAPYYSFDRGGFHFVVLDRNNIRHVAKSTTKPVPPAEFVGYNKGNWYRAAANDISCCDDAQLAWLADDLRRTDRPTVIWAHQPLVATDAPPAVGGGDQLLATIDAANYAALAATGRRRVVAAFFGHDHDDRYAERNGVHYVELNSASYAYHEPPGACFYRDPLFSFVTFDPAGTITIEGSATDYTGHTPDSIRMSIPPRISSRSMATT